MRTDIDAAVLAMRLAAETKAIKEEFGDDAFMLDRRAVAHHEAGHAIGATHEGVTVTRLEIYDEPKPSISALGVVDGFRHGVFLSRGRSDRVTALTDPGTDLSEARIILSGRMAELMSEHGRWSAGLDEMILARAISDIAAKKINTDPERVWRLQVRRPVRKIIKLNKDVADAIAERLLVVGHLRGRRLREILASVKRVEWERWPDGR
jgi:hypothetical protein